MSLILALDTSTRTAALALYDSGDGRCWKAGDLGPGTHGRELVPAVQALIARSGFRVRDLGGIVVGIGPGSFTGLRVGVAVAKTLAEVLDIPVYPLDSLILPVIAAPATPAGPRASIADAQRGTVAVSLYEQKTSNSPWTRRHGPEIMAWNDMIAYCRSVNAALITGPGLELAGRFGPVGIAQAPPDRRVPGPDALVEWLRNGFADAAPADRDTLEPDYLRPSAAEEKRHATLQTGRNEPNL